MPPKATKKQSTSSSSNEEEQGLQAIVLTDSFQTRFMPLTSITPRCLLPLANVPLIEYTLEFLAQSNNITEVYLMCCSHADQIQNYIDNSKWILPSSPFKKIQTIMSLESRSVGDAMRDIDSRGIINGEFVLVSGDVVTNLDLNKVIQFHKLLRSKDKDHIATMVLKQSSQLHRARSQIEPACFILDKHTDRCLYYQDIPSINGSKTSINIDPEYLENCEEFLIRNDLIDCHVDICSPHVPQIFQENFDYQFLRSDFLKGVLSSDLLKKHIYSYITKDEYAARVESWQTYDGIAQDVLERWCYPIVPERNMLDDQTYTYESNHIYKEHNIRLSQSCKIESRVVIGSNSFIGDGTKIEASIIGRNCFIGKNVIIENSYIWDGAKIKDGSIIKHTIVASNAIIGENAIVNSGSVIGFNVIIDDNIIIPNNTKIVEKLIKSNNDFINDLSSFDSDSNNGSDSDSDSDNDNDSNSNSEKSENEEDNEDNENENDDRLGDISIVGEKGIGFIYESETELDDDDSSKQNNNGYNGIIYQLNSLNLSDLSIASTTIAAQRSRRKRRTHSTTSMFISEDEDGKSLLHYNNQNQQDDDEDEDFDKEAVATVERAMENNHDLDTALLELNTLRMSMNVTYHEVRESTSKAMIQRIEHFISTQTLSVKSASEKIFNKWGKLFKRQVFDEDDQIDLMFILQKLLNILDKDYSSSILLHILMILYDEEIIEEDQIFKWWNDEKSINLGHRDKVERWIDWLKTAESDDDDDDESDEESD